MMDSPRIIEYIGLKVSIARLTADRRGYQLIVEANQRRKVSPWSQLFRCAAFNISSTAPEHVGTTWLAFSNRKKQFCCGLRSGDIHASVLSHDRVTHP